VGDPKGRKGVTCLERGKGDGDLAFVWLGFTHTHTHTHTQPPSSPPTVHHAIPAGHAGAARVCQGKKEGGLGISSLLSMMNK
jgi:hypothetical protein